MTYQFYIAFLLFLVVSYNIVAAMRLRWRVMVRAGGRRRVSKRETAIAIAIVVVPLAVIIPSVVFAYFQLAASGNSVFAFVACVLGFGLGTFFLMREVFRAFCVYREMRQTLR